MHVGGVRPTWRSHVCYDGVVIGQYTSGLRYDVDKDGEEGIIGNISERV